MTAAKSGQAGTITSGTPEAIRKQLKASRRSPDDFPPPASLVVASLDGDLQQQSWCNVARAITAASRYVRPGGTIVVWSGIEEPPGGNLLTLGDSTDTIPNEATMDDDFPHWDASVDVARVLGRVAAEHRLLIHSRLPDETIESMGIGSVASMEQLARLSQSFDSCGVLRSAQFAGTTIDTPHQVA